MENAADLLDCEPHRGITMGPRVGSQTDNAVGAFSKHLVDIVAFVNVEVSFFIDLVVRHVCGCSRWLRKVNMGWGEKTTEEARE